jgi:hypothetical protein
LVAWMLASIRKAADERLEDDRQRQKALGEYYDAISDLFIGGKLNHEADGPKSRMLARTRTLTVLRILDGDRKAQLLQFLYEAGLVNAQPIISLTGADFRNAILDEATLVGAEIRGAYFVGASFKGANLGNADLRVRLYTGRL